MCDCDKLEVRVKLLESLLYKTMNAMFGEAISGCSTIVEVIMNDEYQIPTDQANDNFMDEMKALEKPLNLPKEDQAFA